MNRNDETTQLLPSVVLDNSLKVGVWDLIWHNVSYRKLHILYFITLIFVGTLFLVQNPKINLLNAIFMATSSVSLSGISVLPMEILGLSHQILLWLLMIFGSHVLCSLYPVLIRLHYFNRTLQFVSTHFDEIEHGVTPVEHESNIPRHEPNIPSRVAHLARQPSSLASPAGWPFNFNSMIDDVPKDDITRKYEESTQKLPPHLKGALHPVLYRRASTLAPFPSDEPSQHADTLTLQIPPPAPRRHRDSHHRITLESFAQLVKTKSLHALPERNALVLLTVLVPLYMISCISLGTIIMCGWVKTHPEVYNHIRSSGNGDVNPWWYLLFLSTSSFVNCGFNIVSVGVTIFRLQSGPILLVSIGLILAGNTLSPVFLRAIVRGLRWIEDTRLGRREGFYRQLNLPGSLTTAPPKTTSRLLDACDYLLQHPRRVYTLMFPSSATYWILIINVSLTFLGYMLYLALEWTRYDIIGLPNRGKAFFVDGLFSEVNTRSGGMNIFDLYSFHPSVCLWFLVAMYIQVYPIALARRRTNVYVERDVLSDDYAVQRKAGDTFIVDQLRSQVFSEVGFIFLCVFLVITAEASQIDLHETVFALIFEVVSAFGTCGLSMGHPTAPISLSYRFKDITKIVLIVTMFAGRHRGLPASIDKSINLPGLAEVEEAGGLFLAMATQTE
jgi:Trk-type K+ transport system membrane component